ncbi:MAG: CDP-diacylglycerol--serine O-phosphatidyltransferase [Methanosarcinales archaeon]
MKSKNKNNNILKLIRLPDLITLINALFGFSAIIISLNDIKNISNSILLILLAAIADGLDGAISRKCKSSSLFGYNLHEVQASEQENCKDCSNVYANNSEAKRSVDPKATQTFATLARMVRERPKGATSDFGANLDSLADVVSFGVAPAVIAYIVLKETYPFWGIIFSSLYLMCGLLRLARFNVYITNTKNFIGLPITASGVFIALFIMLLREYGIILIILLFFMSVLMVSRVNYLKVRDQRILITLMAIFILLVLSYYLNSNLKQSLSWILFSLIGMYVLSPIVLRRILPPL